MEFLSKVRVTFALLAEASQRGSPHQLHLLLLFCGLEEDWSDVDMVDVFSVGLERIGYL